MQCFKTFFIFIAGFLISKFIFSQPVSFPLKAAPNGHYLVDQNNIPFPILGRTAWFMVSLPKNKYQYFLNETIAKGYNAIEMSAINRDLRGNNSPKAGNQAIPFLQSLTGKPWNGTIVNPIEEEAIPDFNSPNETYWQYLDSVLNYCQSKQILVCLFPAYLGYAGGKEGWGQELFMNGPSKIEAYGKWIANRYKNQRNLVWMLLGDWANLPPGKREVEMALVKGLHSVPHPQSVLYSAEASGGMNSSDDQDIGKEMSLNGVYSWEGSIAALGRKAYAQQPSLPAFLLEEPYDEEGPDGNSVNPSAIQPVRRFQWWGWLCSIGGYMAGNGYVWPFKAPEWELHLNTKTTREMAILNAFFKSIPWWKLVPSGLQGTKNYITLGGGLPDSADYIAVAATRKGSLIVAYFPPDHKDAIKMDLSGLKINTSGYWLDPTNGTKKRISLSIFKNKKEAVIITPGLNSDGSRDWVLVVQSGNKIK